MNQLGRNGFVVALLTAGVFTVLEPGQASTAAMQVSPGAEQGREAALAYAQSNVQLRNAREALQKRGWSTMEIATADVEWFRAPASAEQSSAPLVPWTRLNLLVQHPASGKVIAHLTLAWPAGGDAVLAITPLNGDVVDELIAILGESLSEPETLADAAGAGAGAGAPGEPGDGPITLACGVPGAACGGVTTCCAGLSCVEIQDNRRQCYCADGNRWTVTYSGNATLHTACLGQGRWMHQRRGCGCCDLAANHCGRAVSVPKFTTATGTYLVCDTHLPC